MKTMKKRIFRILFWISVFLSNSFLSSCSFFSKVDFKDPEDVLRHYITNAREGKDEYLYDNLISKESKSIISKQEYIKENSISDSLKKITRYGEFTISEIQTGNQSFKRFKVNSTKTVNDEVISRLKYYTLKNENGEWKVIDLYSLLVKASDLYSKGNYSDAILKYQECLKIDPFYGYVYSQIAVCISLDPTISKIDKEKGILENAKTAISLEVEKSDHYLQLSQYYNEIGDDIQSIETLKKGMSYCVNEKDKTTFLKSISNIYLNKRDLTAAEAFINNSLKLDDKDGSNWYILGKIQHSKEDFQAALTSYRKALHTDNMSKWNRSDLYANYAILNNYFKNCDSAKYYISEALSLFPENTNLQQLFNSIKNCETSKQLINALN